MNVIKNYPVIRLAIGFIFGIIFQYKMNFNNSAFLLLFLAYFLLVFSLNFSKIKITIPHEFIIAFLLGGIWLNLNQLDDSKFPFNEFKIKNSYLYGEIAEIHLPDKKGSKVIVISDSISVNGKIEIVHGSFLISAKTDLSNNFAIGNKIKLNCTISQIKDQRNPGEFNYRSYLNQKGIVGLGYIRNEKSIIILDDHKNIIKDLIFRIRYGIYKRIQNFHNVETSNLLKGLLLADRSSIDHDQKLLFINSGVIHVLAVSGLHVGYILIICILLFGRFNIYLKSTLTIVGLVFFLLITSGQASVLRAVIMAVIGILAFLSNRDYNGFNILSLAALILLIISPEQLFNPGFQLSFSAVFSILFFYPKMRKLIIKFNIKPKSIRSLLLFLAVSISAQIGTIPFTLFYFNKLSVIAIIANLVVIPLIGFLIASAIFTLVISMLSFELAHIYALANDTIVILINHFVKISGSQKWGFFNIYNFSIFDGLMYYFSLFSLIFIFERFKSKTLILICSLLIVSNFIIFSQFDNESFFKKNHLYVMMIDVGQGDSFLVHFSNGKNILIDAGEKSESFDNGERVVSPLLHRLGINKLDCGFISHMDNDHAGGFKYLLKNKVVNNIYKPKEDSSKVYEKGFKHYLSNPEVEINNYSVRKEKIGNSRLYILNDSTWSNGRNISSNNKSGIIKIIYGNISFLFTGDAENSLESKLIDRYSIFLKSDVLKIGHHGSKTSTSDNFLNYVKPKFALVSVGLLNKFHHPSKTTIEKLENRKVVIKRTDLECAVVLETDGYSVNFINWKGEQFQ